MEMQEKIVHVNGIDMNVKIIGEGTPLVMIMGLGAPGDKWAHNYELLSKYFKCIVPDNRGAGKSDKPEGLYTTDMMSDDIIEMMEALEITNAHVMGCSMGGAIAQLVAIKRPDLVKSLCITSSFASVSAAFKKALTIICQLKEDTDPSLVKELNLWMTYGQQTQMHHPEKIEASIAADAAYPIPMPLYAYKAQANACLTHYSLDRLGEIKMPVLIAAGQRDLFMNMEKTMELVNGIPHAEFYLCPEGGHVQQWEYGDVYDSVLLGFLMKND